MIKRTVKEELSTIRKMRKIYVTSRLMKDNTNWDFNEEFKS